MVKTALYTSRFGQRQRHTNTGRNITALVKILNISRQNYMKNI